MSKLVDGKIPAFTSCPFEGQCPVKQEGSCHHQGAQHEVAFSCAAARGFDIIEKYWNEESNESGR